MPGWALVAIPFGAIVTYGALVLPFLGGFCHTYAPIERPLSGYIALVGSMLY